MAADRKILADVRRQVEALPKDKQIVVGTEIVRAALSRIRTRPMRQRTLVSLGDLYAEQGVDEESAEFYNQAIQLDPASELATYSRLKAATVLRRSGHAGAADAMVRALKPVRDGGTGPASLDENIVSAQLDDRIREGQFDQALDWCVELAREFPASQNVLLHYAERVPTALQKAGRLDDAIAAYVKVGESFAVAPKNPLFQSNFISVLRGCDPACDAKQTERLRRAVDNFAANFPDHANGPVFLATLADLYRNQGQDDQARDYYQKAIQHPKVAGDVAQAISKMLDDIKSDAEKRAGKSPVEPARFSPLRLGLLVTNIIVFVGFASWLGYRRWRASR